MFLFQDSEGKSIMKFQSSFEMAFKLYRGREYLTEYNEDVLGQPAKPLEEGEEGQINIH